MTGSFPVFAPVMQPYFVYVGTANSTSDASSYSFATQAIGAVGADRVVVVAASIRDDGASASAQITSPTIGGNAATIAVQLAAAGSAVAIFYLPVAAGTTATIAFSCNSITTERAFIAVYAIYGLANPAPTDTDTVSGASFAALAVQANGIVIASSQSTSNTTFSTSGINEDIDVAVEAATTFVAGSVQSTTTQTAVAVTFTAGAGTTRGVATAWR